jgi:hypothetical protein
MELPHPDERHGEAAVYVDHSLVTATGTSQSEIVAPGTRPIDAPAEVTAPEETPRVAAKLPRLTNALEIVEDPRAHTFTQEGTATPHARVKAGHYIGTLQLPLEVDFTPQEWEMLVSAGQAVIDLGDRANVGVHMSARSYHMLPDRQAYHETQDFLNQERTQGTAACDIVSGVRIDRSYYEQRPPEILKRDLYHEGIHLAEKTYSVAGLRPPDEPTLVFGRYYRMLQESSPEPPTESSLKGGRVLTEAIAEMGKYNILRHVEDPPPLPDIPNYALHNIMFSALVQEAAGFHGMEPGEVETAIYRTHFGGDPTGLQMLKEGVHPDRYAALIETPLDVGYFSTSVVAMRGLFHSGETVRNLQRWFFQKPIHDLYEWQ